MTELDEKESTECEKPKQSTMEDIVNLQLLPKLRIFRRKNKSAFDKQFEWLMSQLEHCLQETQPDLIVDPADAPELACLAYCYVFEDDQDYELQANRYNSWQVFQSLVVKETDDPSCFSFGSLEYQLLSPIWQAQKPPPYWPTSQITHWERQKNQLWLKISQEETVEKLSGFHTKLWHPLVYCFMNETELKGKHTDQELFRQYIFEWSSVLQTVFNNLPSSAWTDIKIKQVRDKHEKTVRERVSEWEKTRFVKKPGQIFCDLVCWGPLDMLLGGGHF